MGLRMREAEGFTPYCWICRNAGKNVILWPQRININPERLDDGTFSSGSFQVYQTSYHPGVISGRRTVILCFDHFKLMVKHWVLIAQQEVDLENLWDSYMDRIER